MSTSLGAGFSSLADAMAQFEGYGTPGTIATRQNNPGNLAYGDFAKQFGATGPGAQNIAVFPNTQAGSNAMDALIQHYASQGYNLGQLIGSWAPPNAPGNTPQSTQNYTNFVAQQTGANPSTPVSQITGQSQQPSSTCAWYDLPCMWRYTTSPKGVSTLAGKAVGINIGGLSLSRIISIVLGLILIAGSIYLFKPTAITTPLKTAGLAA